jgi:hypothetical protein
MKKKILLFVLIGILIHHGLSQNIVTYNYEGKYGIKNKHTGKILVPAKYNKIISLNDSIIIVQSRDYRYGVIDTTDNILVPFSNDKLFIDTYNPYHLGQIIEVSNYESKPGIAFSYYIDKQRNCIPYDYCPCPVWKKLALDSLLIYNYIQKSFKSKYDNQKDSMLFWINMALSIEQDNPFLYYQKANLLLSSNEGKWLKSIDTINENERLIIDSCLNEARLLENRPVYITQIMNLQYWYYKQLKEKEKLKELNSNAKNNDFMRHTDGLYFIGGAAYNNGYEIETGLGLGLFTINDKNMFQPYVVTGLIFLGGSWQKNLTHNIDGYKIYLFSFLKPLRFGISPILYTNYKKGAYVLRPEFGFGFNYLTITAGYNIGVSKTKFSEINTFSFNFRYYLPMSVNKSYSIQ